MHDISNKFKAIKVEVFKNKWSAALIVFKLLLLLQSGCVLADDIDTKQTLDADVKSASKPTSTDGYGLDENTRIQHVKKPLTFKLTFGDSYPVCKEYVDMLNAAKYNEYPACERKILPDFPKFKSVAWSEITEKKEVERIMKVNISLKYRGDFGRSIKKSFPQQEAETWRDTKRVIDTGDYKLYVAKMDIDNNGTVENVYKFVGIWKDAWKYNQCETPNVFYVDDSRDSYNELFFFLSFQDIDLFYKDGKVFSSHWFGRSEKYDIAVYKTPNTQVCGINIQ